MGIKDLLGKVGGASRATHLRDFSGRTVAVDASCWLHRGAFGCARQVVEQLPAPALTAFMLHKANLLRHHGVEPLLVFDGANLRLKAPTDNDRKAKRSASLREARRLHANRDFLAAEKHYQRAIRIGRSHALAVFAALKAASPPIAFVVAPNEADAQLVQCCVEGRASAVMTEDSDLLLFTAAVVAAATGTPAAAIPVLYKLSNDGDVVAVDVDAILGGGSNCSSAAVAAGGRFLRDIADCTPRMLIQVGVLSGCDYAASLKGVGLVTALNAVRQQRGVPDDARLARAVRALRGQRRSSAKKRRAKAARAVERAAAAAAKRAAAPAESASQPASEEPASEERASGESGSQPATEALASFASGEGEGSAAAAAEDDAYIARAQRAEAGFLYQRVFKRGSGGAGARGGHVDHLTALPPRETMSAVLAAAVDGGLLGVALSDDFAVRIARGRMNPSRLGSDEVAPPAAVAHARPARRRAQRAAPAAASKGQRSVASMFRARASAFVVGGGGGGSGGGARTAATQRVMHSPPALSACRAVRRSPRLEAAAAARSGAVDLTRSPDAAAKEVSFAFADLHSPTRGAARSVTDPVSPIAAVPGSGGLCDGAGFGDDSVDLSASSPSGASGISLDVSRLSTSGGSAAEEPYTTVELRVSAGSESAPLPRSASGSSGRGDSCNGAGDGVAGEASIFTAYAAVVARRRPRARAAAIGRRGRPDAAAGRPHKARAANPFAVRRCGASVPAAQASAPHAHYLARPKRTALPQNARAAAPPVLQPGAVAVAYVRAAGDAGDTAAAATKTLSARTAADGWRGGRSAPPSSGAAAARAPRTRTAAESIAETTTKQAARAAQRAAQRARAGAGTGRGGAKRRGARAGATKARARGGRKRAKLAGAATAPSIASFFTRRS